MTDEERAQQAWDAKRAVGELVYGHPPQVYREGWLDGFQEGLRDVTRVELEPAEDSAPEMPDDDDADLKLCFACRGSGFVLRRLELFRGAEEEARSLRAQLASAEAVVEAALAEHRPSVALVKALRAHADAKRCAHCGKPATCLGAYEGGTPDFACDDCCGHGCEDGHCDPIHDAAKAGDSNCEACVSHPGKGNAEARGPASTRTRPAPSARASAGSALRGGRRC